MCPNKDKPSGPNPYDFLVNELENENDEFVQPETLIDV